jgi:CheY-like chemotaxis protein
MPGQHSTTVLAVEDEANDALILTRAFEKAALAGVLRVVPTHAEAVAYLTGDGEYADRVRHPLPDFVLLDLKLPGSSGFELLRWIRSASPTRRLPVVVLTSSKDRRDINRSYDLGANAYLVKPVGFQEMLALVETTARYWLSLCERPSDA